MPKCHDWGSQEGSGRASGKVLMADCISDYFPRSVSRSGITGSKGHGHFIDP